MVRPNVKRGDVVRMYFDTGAMGPTPVFGTVVKAGPATYTVRWEGGRQNRVAQGYGGVARVDDPELLAYAKSKLGAK